MSPVLGPVRYVAEAGMGYLGTANGLRPELGPETATQIDQEVRQLINGAHEQAIELLQRHITILHQIAGVLQEKEVISGEQIKQLVAQGTGRPLPAPTPPITADGNRASA